MLNRDEFAVAMFLIRQQRAPNPVALPAFLPQALVPPSMRSSQQGPAQQLQQQQSGFQQQQQQSAFAPAVQTPTQPKASDDLFGLDDTPSSMSQPALQPQGTGASTSRDPFATGSSQQGSPSSSAQFQSQQTGSGSNSFKPFVPTSAFGASLAAQNTGGSADGYRQSQQSQQAPSTPRGPAAPMPSALDDLLGEPDANPEQSRQIPNDPSELANMTSQITTLRSQMETSQASRTTTQSDLNASATQKRELEGRLKEFRGQYDSEVRAVKELEQQLTTSRAGTKKLEQDLAMLEGTRQDLQSQHKTLTAQLQADQSANADLEAKTTGINDEIEGLRGEVEKLTNEARQLRGLVSISRKQLASNESERSRLEGEKENLTSEVSGLQQEHSEVQAQAQSRSLASATQSPEPMVASPVASPSAGGTSMNPFFKSTPASPEPTPAAPAATTGPTPSAFDAIFGPSTVFAPTGQASSRSGTPPATSFIGRSLPEVGSGDGSSSGDASGSGIGTAAAAAAAGVAAVGAAAVGAVAVAASGSDSGEDSASESPSASESGVQTPPATAIDAQLPAANAVPPLQSESRQITPTQLPLAGGALDASAAAEGSDAGSSVVVVPPASRVGEDMTPRDLASPGPESGSGLALPQSGDLSGDGEREVVPGAFPAEDRGLETTTQEIGSSEELPAPAPTNVADDFDSAFASFGQGESSRDVGGSDDLFAPASEPQTQGSSAEFPPIRSLERDDESESDSDDEGAGGGFDDDFTTASPPRNGVAPASASGAGDAGVGSVAVQGADAATAGDAPDISREVSPPSYVQTGEAQRSAPNSFPPEFGSLLPAREDPTSPPPVAEDRGMTAPVSTNANSNPFDAFSQSQTFDTEASDSFVDASSRPLSSVPDFQQSSTTTAAPTSGLPTGTGQRNVFDEFDDFGDLSEARDADPSAQDDFATIFGGSGQGQSDFAGFDDAFGSSSTANTPSKPSVAPEPTREIQPSNGFAAFTPSASTSGPSVTSYSPFSGISAPSATTASGVQRTPQEVQHDWDAIFSDLDSSKPLDTSFGNSTSTSTAAPIANATTAPTTAAKQQEEEIWLPPPGPPPGRTAITTNGSSSSGGLAAPMAKGAGGRPPIGRAITPGTEHDDPILKRLMGMGYPRADALGALERFDYDINKVSLLVRFSVAFVVSGPWTRGDSQIVLTYLILGC